MVVCSYVNIYVDDMVVDYIRKLRIVVENIFVFIVYIRFPMDLMGSKNVLVLDYNWFKLKIVVAYSVNYFDGFMVMVVNERSIVYYVWCTFIVVYA